jgi:hypothetical protein
MKAEQNKEKRGMVSFWMPYEMHENIKRMGIYNWVTMRNFFKGLAEQALKEHNNQR